MYAEDLKKDLPHKHRTISELITFINTKNETSASYNVFLGAGASATSGIRTGVKLVDEWRKQQFLKLNSENLEEYTAEKAKEWLSRNQMHWYNPQKEYSSLFERAFDLQRQRRTFVESEVRDKFPSLGYVYLIRLIEQRFFDTIFTTNFDDLINETFHQFSEVRPIICAHDSSIKNVTFTSHRPKIIKLHGDYLFDDIKTTLRETETLEKNTRDKFIELSKEVGLIIVGFAGNDRSIMDVLEFLVKDDSFIKNGIYWCLRKEDVVGEELRKLLWNDKVFWVEIEGFDQLFAEIYSELCSPDLPINNNFFNQHYQRVYDEYLQNDFLKNSQCRIISKHLTELEKDKNSNILTDLLRSITPFDEDSNDDIPIDDNLNTFENIQTFLQIQKLEKELNFTELISFVDDKIATIQNNDLKEKLLVRSFNAAKQLFDDKQALSIIERLIEIDSKYVRYYRLKAEVTEGLDEKIAILNEAISINPYSALTYVRKADALSDKSKILIGSEFEKITGDILDLLDQSILINPSINNEAWVLKFENILDFDKTKERNKRLLDIINDLKLQSPYSPIISKLALKFCKHNEERDFDNSDIIKLINENRLKFYPENNVENCIVLLDACRKFNEKEFLETYLEEFDSIKAVRNSSKYIYARANVIANSLANIPRAIETIRQYPNFDKKENLIFFLIDLLIDNEQFEEAKDYLSKYENRLSKEDILLLKTTYYDYQQKSQDALNCYSKMKRDKYETQRNSAHLSYLYLRNKDYKAAKRIAKEFLDQVSFNPKFGEVILNYEFASNKLGNNLHKERLESVLGNANSNKMVKAVCKKMLGDKSDALSYIKEHLSNDFQQATSIVNWAVFEDIKDDLINLRNELRAD